MSSVVELTNALVQAMERSYEYNEYKKTLRILKQNSFYEKVSEYKKRCFEIQMNNAPNALDQIENLRKEYEELLIDPIVKQFLYAEQNVAKMLRQVNASIYNALDIDISFLD